MNKRASDNKTALFVSLACFFGLLFLLGNISKQDIFTEQHIKLPFTNQDTKNWNIVSGLVDLFSSMINVIWNFLTFPLETGNDIISSLLVFLIGSFVGYLALLMVRGN